MQIKKRKMIILSIKLLLLLLIVALFSYTFFRYYEPASQFVKGNFFVIVIYGAILYKLQKIYGAFEVGFSPTWELTYSGSLAIVMSNVLAYLLICLIANKSFLYINFYPLLWLSVLQGVVFGIFCAFANRVYRQLYPISDLVAICTGQDDAILEKLQAASTRYRICRIVVTGDSIPAGVWTSIEQCDTIFIGTIHSKLRELLETYCYAQSKKVYLAPSIPDILTRYATNIQAFDSPVFLCRNKGPSVEQLFLKRTMDIFLSGLGLIIASPLMLAVAVAIKLNDGGPIFFKQARITRGNRIFTLLKFRSMVIDAEKNGAQKAVDKDDRITKVGKFIRATRLDELPQLLNIFIGDMSLVGPRPERCENVEEYSEFIPEFSLRHKMKGGLTGYAQVYGRYNTSPMDKLNMDLLYIEDYSIFLDIKILLLTVKIIFMKESTQGF